MKVLKLDGLSWRIVRPFRWVAPASATSWNCMPMSMPDFRSAVHADAATARFRVARASYTDPAVFAAELERIFGRCWLYVGHDSELAKPDRFVTRDVGGRSVIFLRDR